MIVHDVQSVSTLPDPESILRARQPRIVMAYGCHIGTFPGSNSTVGVGGFGFSIGAPNEIAVGSGAQTTFGLDKSGNAIVAGNYTTMQAAENLKTAQLAITDFLCRPDGWVWDKSVAYVSQMMSILSIAGDVNLEAYVGAFQSPTAAEGAITRQVRGVGFEPQAVLLLWAKYPSLATPGSTQWGGPAYGMGAAGDDLEQWAFQTTNNYLATSGLTSSIHEDDCCFVAIGNAPLVCRGVLTTMDPDGFDVDFDRADVRAGGVGFAIDRRVIGFNALRDSLGGFKVGTGTQPTSTGTQSFTGCGFEPQAVLLGHGNCNAPGVIETPRGPWHVGSFDDDSQSSVLCGRLYGRSLADAAVRFANAGTGISSVASRQSLDADGFTLDWTTVDATARPFGWLAMATEGFSPDCPQNLPQIYRYLRGR